MIIKVSLNSPRGQGASKLCCYWGGDLKVMKKKFWEVIEVRKTVVVAQKIISK